MTELKRSRRAAWLAAGSGRQAVSQQGGHSVRKGWLAPGGALAAALILIAAAVAGLTPMATATSATEPVPSAQGAAQAANRCIKVNVTIPVGSKPVDVAAKPKTNTIYVASGLWPSARCRPG